MLKRYTGFNLLFALIFVVQLFTGFIHAEYLTWIIKPCIVISLLLILFIRTKLKGRFHKRLFTGLLFALAGDVFLLFAGQQETYFKFGLLAFLVGHLFYISAFYLDFKSAPELDKKGARIAIGFCALLAIGFYFYLRPHLGVLKLPVMVYVFVISMMMMMACFRNQRVNMLSFKLIFFGTLFFLSSDAILAINRFVQPIEYAGTWIMATYMIAQYLITMGGIERKLLHND